MPFSEARRPTVLLVEDDPELTLATEMLLYTVGFSMRCEATAHDARATFERCSPEVLITDIGLVGSEDGLSLLKWARKRARDARRQLFSIVISGQAGEWTARSAMEAGADRFYRKPFDPATLVNEVVSATHSEPIGPNLTRAFVDGTRITSVIRHVSR